MDEVVTRSEYLLYVFIASVGVLQLIGVRTPLKGLLFFKNRLLAYLLTFAPIVGSFYWFYVRDDRWDTVMRRTGLEGAQQFWYFSFGAFLAVVFTLVVSSLLTVLKSKRQIRQSNPGQGLEQLKEMSYFEAIKNSFKSKED